jgi:predicted N-acetyltransferase YhbS
MEIRALREDEIEESIEHVSFVFGKPGHLRFRHHMTDDSTFTPEQSRVCVVDGRIVSYVRVSDRPIHIGFAVVRMGGVGAVTTHPDHRGRGYSTAVLWDAVRYMEREGYDLSMLFTGIPRHYARLGWAPLPEHRFSLVTAEPPPVDTAYTVRDFDERRDLDAIIGIYNRYNEQRSGTMARSRQHWLDQHSRDLGIMPSWVVERTAPSSRRPASDRGEHSSQVVAYLRGEANELRELAYLPEHQQAVVPICARAMREAPHVAMRSPAELGAHGEPLIRGDLTKSHPALELLAQWSPRPIRHEETEGMMVRVIRLAPLMQKVAPVLEQRLSQAGLLPRRRAICLREQGQAARIVIEGNHLHIEAQDGGDVILEPGTRSFFRLLLGDATFTQLRELIPGAAGIAPDDAALLDVLFPKQEPVYYACDHF